MCSASLDARTVQFRAGRRLVVFAVFWAMASDRLGMMTRKEKSGGVTSSRIAVAMIVGIMLGGFLAFVKPHGFFPSDSALSIVGRAATHPILPDPRFSLSKGGKSELAKLDEEVNILKKENQQLALNQIHLKKLVRELQTASQQSDRKLQHVKAGPVGTIKSRRTNAHVEPDDSANPELAKLLIAVASNREIVVGVSNKNVLEMLRIWFESLQRSGVTNFVVIALDDETDEFCKANGVNSYRRNAQVAEAQKETGDNHAVSGLKFHLLREFLVLGYSVLLSDVDIVYLQNPFKFLVRDCDVESMTDGFDNATAYGYDDVSDDPGMGWARYAHTMRIWVFNSGLFYIRPTEAAIELLDRVTDRLSKEKAWDQAVFNEELFYPSHVGYEGLHASRRVLDFYLFLNSKVLFKTIRKDDRWKSHKPVSIHVNYHPDKYQRMLAIVDYYVFGNSNALDRFPDGSQW